MSSHPGWDLLVDRARLTLMKKQQRLILGRAEDFEEYKSECAWMDGASWVLDLPRQVDMELQTELETRAANKPRDDEPDED